MPEGRLPWPITPRHFLVYHGVERQIGAREWRKILALDQGHAHGGEVTGSRVVIEHLALGIEGRALDRNDAGGDAAHIERDAAGRRGALHTGHCLQPLQKTIEETAGALFVVAASRRIDAREHDALVIEAGTRDERIAEALEEKARENEHDERDRHLHADQQIARAAASAEAAASAAERLQNVAAGELAGGSQTESDAANHGQKHGEDEADDIEMRDELEREIGRKRDLLERVDPPE